MSLTTQDGVSAGIISVPTLGTNWIFDEAYGNLETETDFNLLQEDGNLILLEQPYA